MFVGEHSYFNFCTIDPSKGAQQSFNRNVLHASIEPVRPQAAAPHPLDIFVFNVKATAFLWHQVRAMVAILFRVGDGIDAPGVVAAMLQPGRFRDKPNYSIVPDDALLLWDCEFPPGVLQWRGDAVDADASAAGEDARADSAGRNLGPMFDICSQIVVRASLMQHVVASSLGGDVRADQIAALTINPRKRAFARRSSAAETMAASPAPFLCGMAVDAVSRKMATREQEIAPAATTMLRAQLK